MNTLIDTTNKNAVILLKFKYESNISRLDGVSYRKIRKRACDIMYFNKRIYFYSLNARRLIIGRKIE